jgi:hypothetical protein
MEYWDFELNYHSNLIMVKSAGRSADRACHGVHKEMYGWQLCTVHAVRGYLLSTACLVPYPTCELPLSLCCSTFSLSQSSVSSSVSKSGVGSQLTVMSADLREIAVIVWPCRPHDYWVFRLAFEVCWEIKSHPCTGIYPQWNRLRCCRSIELKSVSVRNRAKSAEL